MLKKIFYVLFFIIFISSCNRTKQTATHDKPKETEESKNYPKYEDEIKDVFEKHLGYYFYPENPDNIIIIKLSLQDYLILQEVSIKNNVLAEGEKIILDKIYKEPREENKYIFNSINSKYDFSLYNSSNNESVRITYYIDKDKYIYLDTDDNFVKNPDDVAKVLNSINALFSSQEIYIGTFVFDKYEIIRMKNNRYSIEDEEIINKIINEKIVVKKDEDGYLSAVLITSDDTRELGQFLIEKDSKSISNHSIDGTLVSGSKHYYYEDTHTIIYHYHEHLTAGEDYEEEIDYKIIYKRKN
jgi:hypothetical protein